MGAEVETVRTSYSFSSSLNSCCAWVTRDTTSNAAQCSALKSCLSSIQFTEDVGIINNLLRYHLGCSCTMDTSSSSSNAKGTINEGTAIKPIQAAFVAMVVATLLR